MKTDIIDTNMQKTLKDIQLNLPIDALVVSCLASGILRALNRFITIKTNIAKATIIRGLNVEKIAK